MLWPGASDRPARPTGGAAALALAAILAAGPARGQEGNAASISAANQLESWYDTRARESLVDNRLDFRAARGPYAAGATFLSHSPSNATVLDPNDFGPQTQGIRKRWVEASTGQFQARAGHVYGTFGRGLALAIFEDQTVDFDNALDGAQAAARTERAELEILGGTNAYGDPGLVLKAARVGYALPAVWKGALSGVWTDYPLGAGGARAGGDRLYGGSLGGPLASRADLYGEYVLRDRRDAEGGDAAEPQGHAGYVSASVSLGRLQLLGEFKDLLRYDLPAVDNRPFVLPPTAVRAHTSTLLNRGAHTPNIFPADERGGLVEALFRAGDNTRATASYGRSRARHLPYSSWELYGELDHELGATQVILRADETEETLQEGAHLLFFERITFGGTLLQPLPAEWNLEFTAETQSVQESNRTTQPHTFPLEHTGRFATATLSRPDGLSLAVNGEWSDDARLERAQWIWAEIGLRLGERHQLTLGGGRQRGGQVCSGGVCKLVDPFEGGRLELLTQF